MTIHLGIKNRRHNRLISKRMGFKHYTARFFTNHRHYLGHACFKAIGCYYGQPFSSVERSMLYVKYGQPEFRRRII